ncbi:MAG: DUF2147 domain-containing protein [Pseudolabrys sp.]
MSGFVFQIYPSCLASGLAPFPRPNPRGPRARAASACAAVLVLSSLPASAGVAQADDIFGTWKRGDGKALVRIAPCGGAVCATNAWIMDPKAQNENVGDRLVFRIAKAGDDWRGTAYDPQRNLTFTATLTARGESMTTRGCMLAGLVCNTTSWTREQRPRE